MKKHKTGFLVLMLPLASALLMLQSCNNDINETPLPPEVVVPDDVPRDSLTTAITLPTAITMSNDGGSAEVAVSISKDTTWSAAVAGDDAAWCELTPVSGKGNGKFIVTALPNEDRMLRSLEIVVTSGLTSATITVYQKDTLGVSAQDLVIMSNEGGITTLEVEANTLWEVRKANTRDGWLQFTPTHGAGKGVVSMTIEPNKLLAQRSAELIFTAGNATRVITVLQQNITESTYQTDSLALVALYNATDGKGWSNPWDLKQPISTWKGVLVEEVDGIGRVTNLTLPNRELDGPVPLELGNLVCLKKMDLSYNSIKGDLPQEIGNLIHLTELNLAANKFVGSISNSITKLAALTDLHLNNNRFNVFPVEICQLEHLESIYLGNNELTSLPGEVAQMSNLQYLYLDNNLLTALPRGLDKMPNLVYLHASYNKIKGAMPTEIGNMRQLESLRLEFNEFSGSIPASYSNLVSLKYIYLNDNQLTGNLPDMSGMTNLESLYMSNNLLAGDIPSFGKDGQLSALKQIFLDNNQLTGELTEDIRNLTNLESLYMSHNLLTGVLPTGALSDQTNKYPNNPSWETNLYLTKLKAFVLNDNRLTGTVPAGLAQRLTQYSPSFNTSGFTLNNNNLSGPLPAAFKGVATKFNLQKNLYPQRDGVVLAY